MRNSDAKNTSGKKFKKDQILLRKRQSFKAKQLKLANFQLLGKKTKFLS